MLTIAYLGPEGTNTHVAATTRFGRRATYRHAPTVDDVFDLVERRKADYGVVPIENSLEGAVTHTLDRFIDFVDTPVTIHGEIEQPIRHHLLLHRRAKLPMLRVVYSHPQALAQCRPWLDAHLRHVARVETHSTAEAVEKVVNPFTTEWIGIASVTGGKTGASGKGPEPIARAAIARADLAKGKGLRAVPIPESRENTTRFLTLGLDKPRRGRRNKTSLLFGVKDRPGTLHDALLALKQNRINMTKIESRPSKRKAWEYLFFVDLEGHASEPRLRRALRRLARSTSLLRVLGSYPTAPRHDRG